MSLSTVSSTEPIQFRLPTISGDREVIVLTGWAGAGKSRLFDLLLRGLSEQLAAVGAIVNEKSMESAVLDTQRFPERARARAVAGCACCVSIDQIAQNVEDFARQGAKLTIIEQSPLSRTDRIVQRLRMLGFRTSVVAVVNPYQLDGAKSYIYPQIRAADVVVLTHLTAGSAEAENDARRFATLVRDLTKDLSRQPQVFVSGGEGDFETVARLWPVAQTGSQSAPGAGVSNDSGREAARLQDLGNFSELFVHPYPGLSDQQILDALSALATNPEKGADGQSQREPVQVLRAKGVIAGQNVDVTTDARGLRISRSARDPDSPRFDGDDFLLVRTLDPRVFRCTAALYERLGTHECGPSTIDKIKALYPSRERVRTALAAAELEVVLAADTLLWDLIDSLPFLKRIPDLGRQKQVGSALISLLESFLEMRTIFHEELAAHRNLGGAIEFDAAFVTCKVLAHPHLQPILTNPRSPLYEKAQALDRLAPVTLLLRGLSRTDSLSINGRQRLTREDLQWLQIVLGKAHNEGRVPRDLAQTALQNVQQLSAKDPTHSWRTYLPEMERALIQ